MGVWTIATAKLLLFAQKRTTQKYAIQHIFGTNVIIYPFSACYERGGGFKMYFVTFRINAVRKALL